MCYKEGDTPLPPPPPVRFPQLIYMRCNYTFTYVSVLNGVAYAADSVSAVMADSIGTPKVF